MKKHFIALDLDGTTLNNNSQLSPLTIETLQKLSQLNHTVCIVTGRPFRMSFQFYEQLQLTTPLINGNGAFCHLPNDPAWENTTINGLTKPFLQKLLHLHKEVNIGWVAIEEQHTIHVTSSHIIPNQFFSADNVQVNYAITPESDLPAVSVATLWFADEADHDFLLARLHELFGETIGIRVWKGEHPCLELTPPGLNKAVGIKQMRQALNQEDLPLIAFGDELNDVEMLSFADYGVAMKNATTHLKEVANAVTPLSNNEDGVAHYLINYFNLK